jgi:MFS family permease
VLADFTPRSTWGTLFSLRQAGVPAGGVVAAGLGGILVEGYGWVPALEGALAVLAAATLFMSLVPTRFNHARPLVTFEPRRLLTMQALTRPARVVWSTPGLPRLVGAGAGFAMSHGAVTQFMVVYFNSGLGLPLERAAALFAIMQTCAIFGRVVFGAIADRIGSPLLVLTALAPLSALCCLSLTVFDPTWSLPMHVAFALAVGCAVGTWNGLYLAEVARCAAPEKISVTTASASFFTFSAYTVTPPLVGLLARAIGWRPTFALIAVAPLMGALLLRQAVRLPRSFEP